jgi:AcrR family transcriptional regulator
MSPVPKERADAARNRTAVLNAAERLFRTYGVDRVTMDAVAAEAGVGKGTLFRRFRDKAGLAAALLDDRERALQHEIITGPAPLGPHGTNTPAERLSAFFAAYLDYAAGHLELLRVSETATPGARYLIGSYRFWHRHVAYLLGDLQATDPDASAHALLAMVSGEHLLAVIPDLGLRRVQDAVLDAVSRMAYPPAV